jgi:hypothetical protein
MAYYIFLKSLRSLEEFRKNPHVKIPPKSSPTNFQSLCIFKNPIFIRKEFFSSEFGPPGPASPVLARSAPQAACASSAHPGLRGLGVIAKSRLYFEFAQPGDDAFSLCQAGPTYQIHPLPRAGRPWSETPRAATPLRRFPAPRMPLSFYSPPSSLSPLNPLQTEP